jgi:hypothetical protein
MPIPGLAILLAKGKSLKDGPKDSEPEMDSEDDGHSKDETNKAVMSAFIDAVHDKDVDAACQAFADLKDLHEDDGGEEDGD